MSVDLLLSRLKRVRKRGAGQWEACCPAHDDRSPSLSVHENPDGQVLLYCHAYCSIDEITGAIGLNLADLFPKGERTPGGGASPLKRRGLLGPSQALEILHDEALLIAALGCQATRETLSAADKARLLQAANRVLAIADEVRR